MGEESKLDVGEILASSCRQKIVAYLLAHKYATITELVRASGSFNEVSRNLEILSKHEIVTQERVGRNRIITLILENDERQILLEAIKTYNTNLGAKQSRSKLHRSHNAKKKKETIHYQSPELEDKNNQKLAVPADAVALINMPKPLRPTIIALYKTDKATLRGLCNETNLSPADERAVTDELIERGYLKKGKLHNETYFTLSVCGCEELEETN